MKDKKTAIPAGSPVWTYTRDSGGDEQTVDDQNRAVVLHCQERDLTVEHTFCDRARIGSTTAGRDQFQAMVDLVRSLPEERLPTGIIFWSLSRCARDFDDAQFYKADIRRRGIVIDSITDDIPTDSPHGRLIEAIIDWKNAQFLRDLSKDVKRGLRDLALQGYSPGGFPPRGYLAEKVEIGVKNSGEPRVASLWVPDPDTAHLVRQAWEMRAAGASYAEIHQATHLYGSKSSYASLFRNRTYLGIRKCGDLEVEGAHEPLTTPELWEAVQSQIKANAKHGRSWPEGKPHPRRTNSPFLLSGFSRCMYCGAAMFGSRSNVGTRPNPWPYYLCGRKRREGYHCCEGCQINARIAEAAVLQVVLDCVLTPTYVEEMVDAVNEQMAQDVVGVNQQIDAARARLAETNRAIANLLDLAERFGADAAADRLLQRQAEYKAEKEDLRRLEALKERSTIVVPPDVVFDVLANAKENLTGGDVQARRLFLKQFVDKVEMGNEGGKVYHTFPLERLATSLWLVPPRGITGKERQVRHHLRQGKVVPQFSTLTSYLHLVNELAQQRAPRPDVLDRQSLPHGGNAIQHDLR